MLFYAWRLQQTKLCSVTVVDPSVDPNSPISWRSSVFGDATFTPDLLASSVSHLPKLATYDYVILSVPNLQQFQDACAQIQPLLRRDALIVIESTGYVNLEPFVVSSLPKARDLSVCSIMNESDIKRAPGFNSHVCFHRTLSLDLRVYLGVSSSASNQLVPAKDSNTFARFYKMWQLAQEDSKGVISLLKSTNPREFMTYQWKQALPRLVLNPLSVIFEEPYPQDLSRQILAKPLITGLVNEVFKIIKKMECKLVKGFENETNLIKNWLAYFPLPEKSNKNLPQFCESNTLFYDFFHQRDIEVDLLLLQPILLGDDYGVKTPYLENLYSILCQLLKMNSKEGSSFFTRKLDGYDSKKSELEAMTQNLKQLSLEKYQFENNFEERQKLLQNVESQIVQKNQLLAKLLSDHESKTRELSSASQSHQQQLSDINAQLQEKETELQQLLQRVELARQEAASQPAPAPSPAPQARSAQLDVPNNKSAQPQQVEGSTGVQGTPDLSDFADVAMYGAALNGETPPAQREAQRRLGERELELQKREQALQEREHQFTQNPQAQNQGQKPPTHNRSASQPLDELQNYTNYNNYNGYSNGNGNGYAQPEATRGGQEGANQSNGYGAGQTNGYYDASSQQPPQAAQPYQGQVPPQGPPGQYMGYQNAPPARTSQSFPSLSKSQQQQNGSYEGYIDQRPPHGLPPNGFPQSTLPTTLRNPQRYQNGPPGAAQQPPKHRMGSHPNLQMGMPMGSSQMLPGQMPPQQMPPQQMPPQQMPPLQMGMSMGMGGNVPMGGQRKANRRSAFPQMEGSTFNIDYGGRGGMPMPGASNAPPTKSKHRSMMPGQMMQAQQLPPLAQGAQGPQLGQAPPLAHQQLLGQLSQTGRSQQQLQQHLRPPQGASNSGSMTSSNSNDLPKTSTADIQHDIRIEVPVMDAPKEQAAQVAEKQKKKKKGIFGK